MSEQSRALAEIFQSMADLLDVQGANYHRVLAYRRASENLLAIGEPLERIWEEGRLEEIPGIGETLAAKIDEYMQTGQLQAYHALTGEMPEALLDLLEIPGMGPRRVQQVWLEAGITSIDELEAASAAGQLRRLKGFGPRLEQKVLEGIRAWQRQRDARVPLGVAWPLVQEIVEALDEVPGVNRIAAAGSLRRMRETVGDLDLLAATDLPAPVMARFRDLPMVADVLLTGPTKTSIRTIDGLQVDLRVVPAARWGTALQYFTGSQAHNIRLRALAQSQGLSLSEYGFRCENGSEIICAEEAEVYTTLGLPWIPPELREDRGEIDAALEGNLPHLVEVSDLQGDFQCHTTFSDGEHTPEEMARAARSVGLRYLLIADHAAGLETTEGLRPDSFSGYLNALAGLDRAMGEDFKVFAGIEVGIEPDGSLSWPDEMLASLDFVVAALHTDLGQPREQVTRRLLTAMSNPYVDVVGHPTGRLIGHREGADLDVEAVLEAALRNGVALEINAWPLRLDLPSIYVQRAVPLNVPLVISSDAHDRDGFAVLRFGAAVARRGWAEPRHVLNTRSAEELLAWRKRRRSGIRAL